MKKKLKILLRSFVLLIVVGAVFVLGYFCQSNLDTIKNIISDERTIFFQGEGTKTLVSFTSGHRETPYVQDGNKESMVDFGIVKAKFSVTVPETSFNFVLKVGETEYAGLMEKSPYENAYFYDIETTLSTVEPITFSFTLSSVPDTVVTLNPISTTWQIDSSRAIEIAVSQMEKENGFQKIFAGTKIFGTNAKNLEVRLQIISNDNPLLSNHFWHFSLLSATDELFACVIDPLTGQILAQS